MLRVLPLLLLPFTYTPVLTLAGSVQRPDLQLPASAAANRDAVKDIFVRSYESYRKYAFGHDDVLPVSQRSLDSRNGWGASIVDAMSTMYIMGLDDYFTEAINFVKTIDFNVSKTGATVSVFETTIRYLGGLLSAYELSGKKESVLLEKAKQVADKMAFAWQFRGQETRVPFGSLNFARNQPSQSTSNIAEAGTLDLEWATLSKYTGNDTYRRLAEGSARAIANIVSPLTNVELWMTLDGTYQPAPLPGLAAQGIDPSTTSSVGGYITWGGGSDSYFEYLIKYARLTNTNDNLFADTWHTAIDSSIRHLLKNSAVGNYTYLADQDDYGNIVETSSHLACFHGGNWILGGKLLNNETIVSIGLALADACWNTYASTETGIGPEGFAFISQDSLSTLDAISPEQKAFNAQHGFFITSSGYILRPEVLESNFYAWRATGNELYLDRAARAIISFNKYLNVGTSGGFSGLKDANNFSAGRDDHTESFWFAEVLKYLYLTFDDPKHISLDDYVFNTEAHPFEAPPARPLYGSGHILGKSPHPFVLQSPGAPLPQVSPHVSPNNV
ncbi:glycoside hydrolase family 47 protein [Moniliophthora roreri]|nr:glycoside hydrolase family 47 protein [Moniliophthora roreri]